MSRPSLAVAWAACVRPFLGETALMAVACAAVELPLTRHPSAAPLVLPALMRAMLAWYRWGELSLPRTPLGETPAGLRGFVERLGQVAGQRVRAVSVVPDVEPGTFRPGEASARGGEVLFAAADLERLAMYPLLTQAARQLALGTAPASEAPPFLLAAGAACGLLLLLDERCGAVAALLGLAVLGAIYAWRLLARTEALADTIDHRVAELLGQLRTVCPKAFAELSASQGLTLPKPQIGTDLHR